MHLQHDIGGELNPMSDIEHDDGDAPFDRIDALQDETKEAVWPVYVGAVALLGFVGAFVYIQFAGDAGPSDVSLIPDPTITPTERPSGGDLFGGVDFTLTEPEPELPPEPVEEPRLAELAQQVADLEALLAAEDQDEQPGQPQPVADTSALESQLTALLLSLIHI